MELTVLGKSPSWQDRGGACSGYLVRDGDFVLLLDCGSGAFGKLRDQVDYADVDAVLLTHMHPDHVLDLVPFSCALRYSPRFRERAGAPGAPGRPLHVPPGGQATLRALGEAFDDGDLIESAFAVAEYHPGEALAVGPLSARFCEVPHFIRAFAVELSSAVAGGRRLTFGADSGPSGELERFAADTDLLVLEGTQEAVEDAADFRGHMTPREAGELARRARAGRLLVSHFSDEADLERVRAEAIIGFGPEVALAREGLRLTV